MNWSLLWQSLPELLQGSVLNLFIAFWACCIGVCLSIPLALMERHSSRILKWGSLCYLTLFRGTPMIVQIMFVYYVLPQLGVTLPPLLAVIIAMGLNSAAYLSQIIYSGLEAVSAKQISAAKVLGMSRWQAYYYVILPQCFRKILPALGNETTTLLKDSSLASIVGIMELVKVGSVIRGRTFEPLTVLLGVALIYLVLVTALTFLFKQLEIRGQQACCV